LRKLAIIKPNEINLIKELNQEEYDLLDKSIRKVGEFHKTVLFISDVQKTYDEYFEWISKFQTKDINLNQLTDNINRLLLNYLTSIKAFLDRWETRVKRTYGHDSEMAAYFKTITNQKYDESFSYRFIDQLRNYAQHCGEPISTINTSLTEQDEIEVHVYLNRDLFILDFPKLKKKFKPELMQMPLEIELNPHLLIMKNILFDIHNYLLSRSIDRDLIECSLHLLQLEIDNKESGGQIALVGSELNVLELHQAIQNHKRGSLNIQYPPIEQAKLIIKSFIESSREENKVFMFEGRYTGTVDGFPRILESKDGPQLFVSGGQFVEDNGVKWIRIMESKKWLTEDNKDKFFAVYSPAGIKAGDITQLITEYKPICEEYMGKKTRE